MRNGKVDEAMIKHTFEFPDMTDEEFDFSKSLLQHMNELTEARTEEIKSFGGNKEKHLYWNRVTADFCEKIAGAIDSPESLMGAIEAVMHGIAYVRLYRDKNGIQNTETGQAKLDS